MFTKLTPDTKSPNLTLPLCDGTTWSLSSQMPLSFTWLMIYRGYHCDLCEEYLRRLTALRTDIEDAGLNILLASMDTKDDALRAQEEWGLAEFPVAYGLTVQDAESWGLYISNDMQRNQKVAFAEPASFLIRGDQRLYMAAISSIPFARPDLKMFIAGAKAAIETMYPAQGVGC